LSARRLSNAILLIADSAQSRRNAAGDLQG
jgi:hypothetical protein